MDFKKIVPSLALQPYVRNYWIFDLKEEDIPFTQLLFPFGSFELIFNLLNAPDMKVLGEKGSFTQPESIYPGQFTKPFVLNFTQSSKCVGVSLQPWMGKLLFNVPAQEFTDKVMKVDELDNSTFLREKLLLTMNEEDKLIVELEDFLINKLNHYSFDNTSADIAKSIMLDPSAGEFKNIISSIGVTRRRIEQRFLETTGLPMGFFVRKVRFQKAVNLLRFKKELSLTKIGLMAGYYDQSHFIREFKEFSGLTPKEFLQNSTDMKSFVSELML